MSTSKSVVFTTEVFACGPDVPSALHALGDDLGWGAITDFKGPRYCLEVAKDWDCTFLVDGQEHRAAGHDVRGGVIITWWKRSFGRETT